MAGRAAFRTVGWRDAAPLRAAVLGWPPGPVPGDEDASAVHLAWAGDGAVTGVVSFLPHPCPERPGVPAVYLWGMAVAATAQRRGAGSALLAEVRRRAGESGAAVVWADARASAVPFYERHGAVAVGAPFTDDVTGLAGRRVVLDAG